MTRTLLIIILGIFVGLWEVAARPMLPGGFHFPILLPVVILTVITTKPSRALLLTFSATSVMSLYQIFHFDLIVFRWIAIVLIIIFLSKYWLTNRSVYSSMALGIIAQIFDWTSQYVLSRLGILFTHFGRGWMPQYAWYMTMFYDIVLIALGFIVIARMTNKFQLSVQRATGKQNQMYS